LTNSIIKSFNLGVNWHPAILFQTSNRFNYLE